MQMVVFGVADPRGKICLVQSDILKSSLNKQASELFRFHINL